MKTGKRGTSIYAGNSISSWLGIDSEEMYKRNREINSDLLEANSWSLRSIEYKFNEEGFRSDVFSKGDGGLFLGCGVTLGIGMEREYIWTKRVSDYFGIAEWNLGQHGVGADTCCRLGLYWIRRLRPKVVVMLSPVWNRKEIAIKDQYTQYNSDTAPKTDTFRQLTTIRENKELNQIRNILALQHECSRYNIPFYVRQLQSDWMTAIDMPVGNKDRSRDLEHPGVQGHLTIATRFIRDIGRL